MHVDTVESELATKEQNHAISRKVDDPHVKGNKPDSKR